MRIKGIIWIPNFEEKIEQKHDVGAEEVEEILFSNPKTYLVERGHRKGENMYVAHGQTDSGRYLVVFFILKQDNRALVVSARDMDRKEKKRYGKRKR